MFWRCRMASLTLGQRLLNVQTPSPQRTHPSLSNLSSWPTQETFKASCAKLHARSQGTEIELSSVHKSLTPHWPEKKKKKKQTFSVSVQLQISRLPDFKEDQNFPATLLSELPARHLWMDINYNFQKYEEISLTDGCLSVSWPHGIFSLPLFLISKQADRC